MFVGILRKLIGMHRNYKELLGINIILLGFELEIKDFCILHVHMHCIMPYFYRGLFRRSFARFPSLRPNSQSCAISIASREHAYSLLLDSYTLVQVRARKELCLSRMHSPHSNGLKPRRYYYSDWHFIVAYIIFILL